MTEESDDIRPPRRGVADHASLIARLGGLLFALVGVVWVMRGGADTISKGVTLLLETPTAGSGAASPATPTAAAADPTSVAMGRVHFAVSLAEREARRSAQAGNDAEARP